MRSLEAVAVEPAIFKDGEDAVALGEMMARAMGAFGATSEATVRSDVRCIRFKPPRPLTARKLLSRIEGTRSTTAPSCFA